MADDFADDDAPEPSPRQQAAVDVDRWLCRVGLGHPRERPRRSPRTRCWVVHYQAPGVYGTVQVWSANYVRVTYVADRPGWPLQGARLFQSVEVAMAWLEFAFLLDQPARAAAVPERPPRRPLTA